jgi:hypothetical protein
VLLASGAARAQDPWAGAGNPSANIDQARNGTADSPVSPVDFQNGNAGSSNSHYLEGHSIPYRVRLEGLTPGSHTVTLGWDFRQSGVYALDYLTAPDRLEPHGQFLPVHGREQVNPLAGISGSYAGPNRFAIPTPTHLLTGQALATFLATPAAERELWMYNGEITAIEYVPNADGNMGDPTANTSEARMRITFTPHASKVVLAFGGHIASQADWGSGKSASAISGSPYHARVVKIDEAGVGNQDRSLSASAVLACNVVSPASACPGSIVTFSEISNDQDVSYLWSFEANSSGATIVGSNTGSSVQVNVGSAVNGAEGFTLKVNLSTSRSAVSCAVPFTVTPGPRAAVEDRLLCPGSSVVLNANATSGDGAYTYLWSNGATTPSITVSTAGTYAVTVTDGKGCKITDSGVVTLLPAVNAAFTGVTTLCPNGTTTFTGPAGMSSYQWSVTGGTIVGAADGSSVTVVAGATCGSSMTVSLSVQSGNGCNGSSSKTVAVQDTKAPVFQGVGGALSIECPATPVFSVPTATDECGGTVTISHQDVRTAGRCAQEYVLTRTWTARDACGNTATASQAVTVTDRTAPVFAALPAPQTIECPATPQFAIASVTDACDAQPQVTFQDVTTPGACLGERTVTRTWTARDACGNTSTAQQMIHVVDRTAPVFAALPGPSTIDCPATPLFATAIATDACDAMPTVTFVDHTQPGTCAGRYTVTRTWTAVDDCGNRSSVSQVITVRDQTPPVLTMPADMTLPACQNPVFFTPTGVDGCGGTVAITSVPASGTTFPVGTTTVTVTARDACGNEARATFQVTVTPNPSGAIAGSRIACPGGSSVLTGPAGFFYRWNTGATTQSITVTQTGTYTLTITDKVTGCSSTLSAQFTIVPKPVATISGPDRFCEGTTATLCGPTGPYRYQWTGANGFTAQTRCITTEATADYHLVVTDTLTGCTSDEGSKSPVAAHCTPHCPHTIGWWTAQCDGSGGDGSKYTSSQLERIFACVDEKVRIFNWADDAAGFCSTVNPDGNDARRQAKRQYVVFVANVCTSELLIRAANGERIVIDMETRISYPGLQSRTLGELLVEIDDIMMALESRSLNEDNVRSMYNLITEVLNGSNTGQIQDTYCPNPQVVRAPIDPMDPGLQPVPTSATIETAPENISIRFYSPTPNPFTHSTRIAYAVGSEGANVDVAVFDLAGRRVKQLDQGFRMAGRHEVQWNGRDVDGALVRGGMYFVRARIGTEARLMTIVHIR